MTSARQEQSSKNCTEFGLAGEQRDKIRPEIDEASEVEPQLAKCALESLLLAHGLGRLADVDVPSTSYDFLELLHVHTSEHANDWMNG